MSAYASRIERLRALFDEAEIDGLLISQPESRFYLSGYTGHDLPPRDSAGYLMIGKSGALLLTDPRTSEQAENEAPDYKVVVYSANARTESAAGRVGQGAWASRKLGFESIHLPYAIWQTFSERSGRRGTEATTTPRPRPGRRDGAAQGSGGQAADHQGRRRDGEPPGGHRRPGRLLHAPRRSTSSGSGAPRRRSPWPSSSTSRVGATATSFPSIVASGPNSSMPHAVPTDRKIQEGEPITIDIGAMVNGYCSDMTRTVCIGTPSEKLREIHGLVLEAQERAEQNIKNGMTGKDADALARDFLAEMGYGESVHPRPRATASGWKSTSRRASRSGAASRSRDGMVFSVEPGIYLPGGAASASRISS